MNAILSEKGQVTIPKIIRDELGLEAGVVLDFHEEQGRIIVAKVTKNPPFSA
jgi:AbrB family looped-hinge helix DNA binding protein